MAKIKVLLIGRFSNEDVTDVDPDHEIEIHCCGDKAALQELVRSSAPKNYQVIFCGGDLPGMSTNELGQILRMLCPEAQIFFAAFDPATVDEKLIIKNGFTSSFLMSERKDFFKKFLNQLLGDAEKKLYTPIPLCDLDIEIPVTFEVRVYLEKNQRFIPFMAPGDIFDKARMARLKIFNVNLVFVAFEDLAKYHSYSAQRLMSLAADEPGAVVSEEKRRRLQVSVKGLVQGLLNETSSKTSNTKKINLEHSRLIIEQYLSIKYPGEWFKKIRWMALGTENLFFHATNVTAYAILFSMLLKSGDHKDMATLGMLHDLGLASLPKKLLGKPTDKMTPEEFKIYKSHPERSLRAIKENKIEISDLCTEAIQFHHERWVGGGFPLGLKGSSLSSETQILALADRFSELTHAELSATPLSLDQALSQIENEGIAAPEFIKILREILLQPEP